MRVATGIPGRAVRIEYGYDPQIDALRCSALESVCDRDPRTLVAVDATDNSSLTWLSVSPTS